MCRWTTLLLLSPFIKSVLGAHSNVTVDDSHAAIVYSPSSSWKTGLMGCLDCPEIDPSIDPHRPSFHNGTHVLPPDDDDFRDDKRQDDRRRRSVPSRHHWEARNLGIGRRLDADDPGFVDTPVTVEFNFTGSAIYMYCIQPLAGAGFTYTSPSAMNLTFILDNQRVGQFISAPPRSNSSDQFAHNVNILSHSGMVNGPHSLKVYLESNSILLLDYFQYTVEDSDDATTSTNGNSTSDATSGSQSGGDNQHNVATFVIAIACSAGILAVVVLCLAGSIYHRRRKYARKQREHQGEEGTNNPNPEMAGPAPFVPRFFPGTVPSEAPPSYPESMPVTSSQPGIPYQAPPGLIHAGQSAKDGEPLPTFREAVASQPDGSALEFTLHGSDHKETIGT